MYIEKYKAHIVWKHQIDSFHYVAPIKLRDMYVADVVIAYTGIVDGNINIHIHKNRHTTNDHGFWSWFRSEYPLATFTFDTITISDPFEAIKFKFTYQPTT